MTSQVWWHFEYETPQLALSCVFSSSKYYRVIGNPNQLSANTMSHQLHQANEVRKVPPLRSRISYRHSLHYFGTTDLTVRPYKLRPLSSPTPEPNAQRRFVMKTRFSPSISSCSSHGRTFTSPSGLCLLPLFLWSVLPLFQLPCQGILLARSWKYQPVGHGTRARVWLAGAYYLWTQNLIICRRLSLSRVYSSSKSRKNALPDGLLSSVGLVITAAR